MKPLVGSLFSGIGGIDKGLELAGFEVAWQIEIDEFCQKVLHKHWPHVPKWRNITHVRGTELRTVDLICGGFPCQPVSYAGNQRAQADERWLWPEFARLIRILRPRYVLVENVPGLLRRGIEDVLGDLAASGYDAEWEGLPASAFGAPHERQRIWIVAYTDDWHTPERRECEVTATESNRRRDNVGRNDDNVGRQKSIRRTGDNTSNEDANTERVNGRQRWERRSTGIGEGTVERQTSGKETSGVQSSFATDADSKRREESRRSSTVFPQQFDVERSSWWSIEPGMDRISDGLSRKLDENRLRALGNSVVPICVEWIGQRIMEHAGWNEITHSVDSRNTDV